MRTLARITLIPLLVSVVVAACGTNDEQPIRKAPDVTVTDSSGIRIVENRVPDGPYPRAFRVGTPTVTIGQVEAHGAQQLFRVRGAARLSDERIAILDGGTNEVRVFGPDGNHLVTFAGHGDGPGEFRFAAGIAVVGPDTIVVWEGATWEASWFSSDGSLLRTSPGRDNYGAVVPEGWVVEGLTVLPGTGLLLQAYKFGGDHRVGEVHRPDRELIFVNTVAGTSHALEGEYDGVEQTYVDVQGRRIFVPVPFGRLSYYAAGYGAVWGGDTDRFLLRRFDSAGRLVALVSLDERRAPVRQEDVDDLYGRMERSMVDMGVPDSVARSRLAMARSVSPADSMPAFGRILVTRNGGAWVSRMNTVFADQSGGVYHVFSRDGAWRGVVQMPLRTHPMEIGPGYVIALRTDDLGIEYVELYDLASP